MKKVLYNLFFPLCIVAILVAGILAVSQYRPFYNSQYQKNDAEFYTGLSLQDLEKVTDNLILYLSGAKDNLDMQFPVEGKLREIFDEREKAHMIDVKKLYINVIVFEVFLLVGISAMLVYFFKTENAVKIRQILYVKYKTTLVVSTGLIVLLGAVFWFNFNWFWTNFHKVFFSNDLWILDPSVSVMINMFPLNFFFEMCSTILLLFVLGCVAVYILLMPKNKKTNK